LVNRSSDQCGDTKRAGHWHGSTYIENITFAALTENNRKIEVRAEMSGRDLALRTEQQVRSRKWRLWAGLRGGIAHDFNNQFTVIHWKIELF
jgi:hypothetical protein